jgi:hypothetical protein
MFDIKIDWSEPKKVNSKWQREWLIPVEFRSQFFIAWKKHKFNLFARGFGVQKRNTDWFLVESQDFKNDLRGFDSNDRDDVTEKKEEPFWTPPYEVKNSEGLRPWQVNTVSKLVGVVEKLGSTVDGSSMGVGKCHTKGTLIRMYDGSVKKVEDIVNGDLLMGDDSTPRKVLNTNTGYGELYNIHPRNGGEVFGTNGDHILVLKNTTTKELLEISVKNYIFKCTSSCQFYNLWKLFRVGVEYASRNITVDPYYMGLWLGDGTWCRMEISVADIDVEIQDFLKEYAIKEGMRLVIGNPRMYNGREAKCKPYNLRGCEEGINSLLRKMKEFGLTVNKEKFIPEVYIHNSREVRLKLLAGIVDSDGSHYNSGCYEVSCKYDWFQEQITELARSLGYCVNPIKVDRTWSYKGKRYVGKYWRISISGAHDLPCKLKRKFSKPRLQPKNVLHTAFGVEPIGCGEYYGFTLDGNSKYLLKDFTVTHNTYQAVGVVRELDADFVVVCPKAVMNQWKNVIHNHFKMGHKLIGIINYELLIRGRTDSKIASYVEDRRTHRKEFVWKIPKRNSIILWDEAHKLKNYKTKNSKTCIAAHKQGYRQLFLSATIATNPLEIRTIGTCLKLFKGNKDYYTFLNEHGCEKGRWGMEFNNDKKSLQKLHKYFFEERGVRLKRDDIIGFPECEIEIEAYDLDEESTSKINQIYDEMKRELKSLDSKIKKDGDSELTIRLRARQKCEILKVPIFADMAQEAVEEGMSVVVFLNFSDSIDALARLLNTECIFDGRYPNELREYNKEQFQDNKEKVIIINTAAGGVGLSLPDTTGLNPRIALISPDDSAFKMRQVQGRIWRESSKSKSLQRIIYTAGTVEEIVCNNVKQKLDNLDLINDDDLKVN